jgi:glutamine amidotransferase
MLGYLGRTATLASLVEAPPHSLERQSYEPKLQSALVNADGWGAGWYLDGDPEPCLYRSTAPIWADVNRGHICRAARSGCMLAAVRSSTDPLSLSLANTQPFAAGRVAFLHNGFISAFDRKVARRLRESLGDESHERLRGNTDSEHVFAVLLDEYARFDPAPTRLADAVRGALSRVTELARQADTQALLTLLVSDGEQLVAARSSLGAEAPSLFLSAGPSPLAPGVVIASEPLDDSTAWTEVPTDTLLVVERGSPPRRVALS